MRNVIFMQPDTMGPLMPHDPGTLLIAASTAVSAIGAISQGNAQSASYQAQAQGNAYNATVERQNADRVSQEYSVKEDNLRRQQALFLGKQRAGLAQADIGTGGSAADVEGEDTINANLDDLTLRYEGQTRRTAYLNQGKLDTYQSSVDNMNASSAQQAGYIGAMGSVFGGAGRYMNYSKTGQIGASYG